MTVKDLIKQQIEKALQNAIAQGVFSDADFPTIKIEYPKEAKFGDYATPFALECAKILKKAPLEIGNSLKPFIENADFIDSVDVVKPGFINIFLSHSFLCEKMKKVHSEDEQFGKYKIENPKRIIIEFVSANPTGPLNVVSARAAALGDTLATLLEAIGHTVDREFYVNDYGNQVYLLGKSVLARIKELQNEEGIFPEDGYQGEYIKDIAQDIINNALDEYSQIKDEEEIIHFCSAHAVAYNVSGQKKDLEQFNVTFKEFFSEKSLHERGFVLDTFSLFESKSAIYDEEGKKIFRSTEFGDDKDRVVIRDDGRPTYLMADIAYHRNKIDRAYDLIIDIWGPDHHGYIARLSGAMDLMGYNENKFKVLIAQQVNLLMDGELVKMSKRLGKFSTMKDLIEEIGVDVARYFFVMRSMDSHLDFDITLAKKESSENPVFYLQYAHARICSLFKEAEKRNLNISEDVIKIEFLQSDEAQNLLKLIVKFPEEIYDAATSYEPHRICTFLLKFAASFHKFYTEHRILSDDIVKTSTYLYLATAVKIVMRNGLTLLGVSAPEKM